MTSKASSQCDAWPKQTKHQTDRTSQTDDARIKDITVLPPLNI
jgi:hypothetical protein